MKTRIAALLLVASLAGCHNFPKDSYGQGVKSTVNTPWGPSTLEVEIIATGSAAKNISLPETPVILKRK
jgi:ABC-type uncharacterized transport system auxiliary subunit